MPCRLCTLADYPIVYFRRPSLRTFGRLLTPLGQQSHCYLQIYEGQPGTLPVVIATELPDNPGMSVTNAAEVLASQVWREVLPHARDGVRWFEHYPPRPSRRRELGEEDFDEATFRIVGPYRLDTPVWRPSSRAAVEALIGEPFSVPAERLAADERLPS